MSRTRLTALVVCLGVGAAALVPAAAAPAAPAAAAPAVPAVDPLEPQRALHSAVSRLLSSPAPERLGELRSAHERSLRSARSADTAVTDGPGESAYVTSAGDVDGDRRSDVILARRSGTQVRSGKDGRVLLSRGEGMLFPVTGAGAVRLLEVQHNYEESGRGLAIEVVLTGLDRTGRAVWEHAYGGTVTFVGVGPAYVVRATDVPIMIDDRQVDPEGRPALMIGSLSATQSRAEAVSTLAPALLSLVDGAVTELPVVRGAGSGVPWAYPVTAAGDARSCYATAAPLGPISRLALTCDGTALWSATVRLRDPYVESGGDFDGDALPDLVAGTYGWERPRPREVLRGTRVLSFADGSEVGRSRLDSLSPLGQDISKDGQPDFLEVAYGPGDVAVQAVTLAGDEVWRRSVLLQDSYPAVWLGLDLTGDGLGDALVLVQPEKGPVTTVVVNGRNGKAFTLRDVDGLLLPGLRSRGADFAVLEARSGRAHAIVLSGDGGRRLLAVTVPGPPGRVSPAGAGAVDVDRDGRRDLLVASRTDDQQVTTAFSGASGRVLWQQREEAVAVVRLEVVAEPCC